MKWYQAMADFSRDEEVVAFLETAKQPFQAYGFLHRLMEAVCEQWDGISEPELKHTAKGWGMVLGCHTNGAKTWLERVGGIAWVSVTLEGNAYRVCIPKLKELKDNATRNSQAACKQVVLHHPTPHHITPHHPTGGGGDSENGASVAASKALETAESCLKHYGLDGTLPRKDIGDDVKLLAACAVASLSLEVDPREVNRFIKGIEAELGNKAWAVAGTLQAMKESHEPIGKPWEYFKAGVKVRAEGNGTG